MDEAAEIGLLGSRFPVEYGGAGDVDDFDAQRFYRDKDHPALRGDNRGAKERDRARTTLVMTGSPTPATQTAITNVRSPEFNRLQDQR
nr:acyl-CoA dehydrogenase family protein [Natrialba aegyptia]